MKREGPAGLKLIFYLNVKHFTAYQWTIGLVELALYFRWIFTLWRDALLPTTELTRFQLAIRMTGAAVFSVALLAAIPYWLGVWK
jgi:hypothetical protein